MMVSSSSARLSSAWAKSRNCTGTTGNGRSPYRAVSKRSAGGMTLGPWEVEVAPVDSVAVADRSFQTIWGSSVVVSASEMTTSVARAGPVSLAAASSPRVQVSVPSVPMAASPLAVRTSVTARPSTAGIVTVRPLNGVASKLLTMTRDGNSSPGLTQPTEDVKSWSTWTPAAWAKVTAPAPATAVPSAATARTAHVSR